MDAISPSTSIASGIHNFCINAATENNTHVVNAGMTGGPITVVDHEGVLEDYGQCVYDLSQVSPQAQEKPQSPVSEIIEIIVGSHDSKPNGIGSTIADGLENSNLILCEMHPGGTCVNVSMPIHK